MYYSADCTYFADYTYFAVRTASVVVDHTASVAVVRTASVADHFLHMNHILDMYTDHLAPDIHNYYKPFLSSNINALLYTV